MGRYLQIGAEEEKSLASNAGWGDVLTWAGTLPDGQFMEFRHLCEYGWTQNLDNVRHDVELALKQHLPKKHDVVSTLHNLIELLDERDEDAVTATVTDGTGEA